VIITAAASAVILRMLITPCVAVITLAFRSLH
jgi:hypothetical protein